MSQAQDPSLLRPATAARDRLKLPFEFDGVVRLTRTGTAYVAGTIVLAVAAVNTGNNALYIGVSFMLGCLLLSGLASKGGLKHLEIELSGIDEAWAGRVSEGSIRVRNRSRVWNVRDVVLTSGSLAEPVFLPIVARGAVAQARAAFLFRRRGLARVEAIDSYTRYPFGFVLKKRRLKVISEVVVFPEILPGELPRESFRPVAGEEVPSGRQGGGSDLHSFREYARGDSLRHVHWKKSASLGRWIIKQTESDASRSVHVVVDPFRPRGVTDDEFERMIASAATFIYHAARRGLDVTLSLPRVSVRATESQPATRLFRALALLEPVYEPMVIPLERECVVFSAGGRGDAKSA